MSFLEAFEKYIKGKKVKDLAYFPEYGDHNTPFEERFYGHGVVVTGGYKFLCFGGGCSGEDCNTSFIVSPKNKLVARTDW